MIYARERRYRNAHRYRIENGAALIVLNCVNLIVEKILAGSRIHFCLFFPKYLLKKFSITKVKPSHHRDFSGNAIYISNL